MRKIVGDDTIITSNGDNAAADDDIEQSLGVAFTTSNYPDLSSDESLSSLLSAPPIGVNDDDDDDDEGKECCICMNYIDPTKNNCTTACGHKVTTL